MIRRGLSSVAGTWLAGLLVTLPLVVTLAILAWAFDVVRGLVGPGTLVAKAFAALGYPFTQNPRLATLVGVLVMLGAIYVVGLTARSRLILPLRAFVDRTIKRIPLIGNVYELADRFVGVLGPKSGTDLAAMRPVWCFFGGDGVAVLALSPSSEPVLIDGREYYAVVIPTAPVPIGGALLYVPAAWIKSAPIGMDKLTATYVSMGITPPVAASRERG